MVTIEDKIEFLNKLLKALLDEKVSHVSGRRNYSLCVTARHINSKIYTSWFKNQLLEDALEFDFWYVPYERTAVHISKVDAKRNYFYWNPNDFDSRTEYLENLKTMLINKLHNHE